MTHPEDFIPEGVEPAPAPPSHSDPSPNTTIPLEGNRFASLATFADPDLDPVVMLTLYDTALGTCYPARLNGQDAMRLGDAISKAGRLVFDAEQRNE